MAPAVVPELRPTVEVLLRAAYVDETIDGTGSAEAFATGLIESAITELGFRLALVAPVHLRVLKQPRGTIGDPDPWIAILATGFEQQNPMLTGLGQSIGKHAAGGAGAADDVD